VSDFALSGEPNVPPWSKDSEFSVSGSGPLSVDLPDANWVALWITGTPVSASFEQLGLRVNGTSSGYAYRRLDGSSTSNASEVPLVDDNKMMGRVLTIARADRDNQIGGHIKHTDGGRAPPTVPALSWRCGASPPITSAEFVNIEGTSNFGLIGEVYAL
jgi:hypothetical protein